MNPLDDLIRHHAAGATPPTVPGPAEASPPLSTPVTTPKLPESSPMRPAEARTDCMENVVDPPATPPGPDPPDAGSGLPRGRPHPARPPMVDPKAPFAGSAPEEARSKALTEEPPTRILTLPYFDMDLPAVVTWEAPANTPESAGRAIPKGVSEKQEMYARKIKSSAMPRIENALDDLLHRRGEDDLRDVGRGAVLGLLDRIDARQWIDWSKSKGPVDALVVALWGRCRKQALYRRALPEARAWRDAIAECEIGTGEAGPDPASLAVPPASGAVASSPEGTAAADGTEMSAGEAACERAGRLGYAVIGPVDLPFFEAYKAWCAAHRIARVVIDDTGLDHGEFGGEPGTFAGVYATPDYPTHFSGRALAEMEASCRVCIRPDGPPSDVSVDPRGVSAIVPTELARPLAARLHALVTRPEPRENTRTERRPVDTPAGPHQDPSVSPPSDIETSKDAQTMAMDTNENTKRRRPLSVRPRPAEATPTPADDGTDAPPPARRDETGEEERPIIRKRPSFARPRSGTPPRPESASAPAVLDPARQGRPVAPQQIADDLEAAGRRPPAERPAAGPEPTGSDAPSLDERIAWFLEAEDEREFSDRVLGALHRATGNLLEDIPALAASGRLGARNLVALSTYFQFFKEVVLDHEVEEEIQMAYETFDADLLDEAYAAQFG